MHDAEDSLNPEKSLTRAQRLLQRKISSELAPFMKRWLDDSNPDRRGNETVEDTEAASRNAYRISYVLASLKGILSLEGWPKRGIIKTGSVIYFPKTEKMTESRFVSVPKTPADFLDLLSLYEQEGELTESDIPTQEEIELLEIIPNPEDATELIEELYRGLIRDVSNLDDYALWLAHNKGKFKPEILSQSIELGGISTDLRAEINKFALHLIQKRRKDIRLMEYFSAFRNEVVQCGFFPSYHVPVRLDMPDVKIAKLVSRYVDPSRKAANKIVGETFRHLLVDEIKKIENKGKWETKYREFSDFEASEVGLPRKEQILGPIDRAQIRSAFTRKARVFGGSV